MNSPALLLANINFEPAPAAETLRELPEQNSSAQPFPIAVPAACACAACAPLLVMAVRAWYYNT